MSLQTSIFREASQSSSPSQSLSLSYSCETESSCGGIETWISDQRCSSPEILWEDQSMKLFRFRQEGTKKSAPKATMSYPPKTSMSAMSYEKYRRQHPTVSKSDGALGERLVDSDPTKRKNSIYSSDSRSSQNSSRAQSVSCELAAVWLQMGESRQSVSTCSVGDVTSSSSSSSSGSSESSSGGNPTTTATTTTTSLEDNNDDAALFFRHCRVRPVEDGAPPRRRSSSLAVSAGRQLWKQRPVRDSVSRDYPKTDQPWQHEKRPNKTSQAHEDAREERAKDRVSNATIRGHRNEDENVVKNTKIAEAEKTACARQSNNNRRILPPKPPKKAPQGPSASKRGVFRLNRNKDPPRNNRGRRNLHLKQRPGTRPTSTERRDSVMTAKTMWRTAVDPSSGRTYYFHVETRETQWRKPLELATDAEKEEMRKKEEQQRSFFAAMEANILKNLESGAMVETTQAAEDAERTANFLPTRSVDGGTTAQEEVDRPGLIRTISTMDRQVLSQLVKRQPSNRNLFVDSLSADASGQSPTDVIPPQLQATTSTEFLTNQTKTLSLNEYADESVGQGGNRYESEESIRQESVGTFLSSLPDDEQGSSRMGRSYLSSLGAGSFYDTSADDLGITEEEMDELTKLACISDQMSGLETSTATAVSATTKEEKQENDSFRYTTAGPRATAIRASMRASMTKISLEVLKEDDISDNSDEADKEEAAPTEERKKALENVCDNGDGGPLQRPKMTRRNTCGTIYVGSTMAAPDKDATIKCICGVYRAHILQSERENAPNKGPYLIFNDLETQRKPSKTPMEEIDTPSLEEITAFYRDVFRRSQMETDCLIMSLIYVERLIRRTNGELRPRCGNWRSVLFSSMILASKVWDDLSMWNADFSQTCPSGVRFPLQRINELEIEVLSALAYDVKVPASEYAKYYFLLRSMLIKSGLGSETLHAMNPLDITGAQKLQQMSARYQTSRSQFPSRPDAMTRRSVSGTHVRADLKANLEHMVDL